MSLKEVQGLAHKISHAIAAPALPLYCNRPQTEKAAVAAASQAVLAFNKRMYISDYESFQRSVDDVIAAALRYLGACTEELNKRADVLAGLGAAVDAQLLSRERTGLDTLNCIYDCSTGLITALSHMHFARTALHGQSVFMPSACSDAVVEERGKHVAAYSRGMRAMSAVLRQLEGEEVWQDHCMRMLADVGKLRFHTMLTLLNNGLPACQLFHTVFLSSLVQFAVPLTQKPGNAAWAVFRRMWFMYILRAGETGYMQQLVQALHSVQLPLSVLVQRLNLLDYLRDARAWSALDAHLLGLNLTSSSPSSSSAAALAPAGDQQQQVLMLLLEAMEDMFNQECPVCYGDLGLANVVILPCTPPTALSGPFHMLCMACYSQLQQPKQCPMCRTAAPVGYNVQQWLAICRMMMANAAQQQQD